MRATTQTDRPEILDEPTTPLNARDVYAALNLPDKWTLARIGATNRMYDTTYVQLDMTLERKRRRLYVTVAPDDTYSVEVGRFGSIRSGSRWTQAAVRRGVYAEQLGATVLALFEEVMGA